MYSAWYDWCQIQNFGQGMLVVPSVQASIGRLDGPIRADHAVFVCETPGRLSASTTCLYPHHMAFRPSVWATPLAPLSSGPTSAFSRPTSLILEAHKSLGPPPLRAIATNPRVRRRSTAELTPSMVPPPVPPHAAPLESLRKTADAAVETDSCTYSSSQESRPGPIKTKRAERRSSGAKELFQGLRRSAKKKIDRLRRSVSTGRLGNRRQAYGVQAAPEVVRPEPLCRRCSAPNISRVVEDCGCPWDVFPRAQLLSVHRDGSRTLRLERHPQAAFGFFVAQDAKRGRGGMFISRINRADVAARLSGFLEVGDQLLGVEDVSCAALSLNQLYDIVGKRLVVHLRVLPRSRR